MLSRHWWNTDLVVFGRVRVLCFWVFIGIALVAILDSAWCCIKSFSIGTAVNALLLSVHCIRMGMLDLPAVSIAQHMLTLILLWFSNFSLRGVGLASGVCLNKSNKCWNQRNQQNSNNNKLEIVLYYWNTTEEVPK